MKSLDLDPKLLQKNLKYDNMNVGFCMKKMEEQIISEEDVEKLCELYKKETEELNADTERRKNHIAQMLKELKNT